MLALLCRLMSPKDPLAGRSDPENESTPSDNLRTRQPNNEDAPREEQEHALADVLDAASTEIPAVKASTKAPRARNKLKKKRKGAH